MPNSNLTDLTIQRLPAPERGTVTYWDTTTKGLGFRLSSGGARTFIVLIESGRRQKIGRYPALSLKDARIEAKRLLAEKALGKVRPLHRAFDDAKELYLAECRLKNRPRTVDGYKRLLERHFPFGRRSVGDITPRDIQKELGKLAATPGQRHHAFTAGRAFFRWCVGQHLIERSPMEHVRVPLVGTPRERVLSTDELKAVFATAIAGTTPFHRIVALLVLTGQRRGEIAALQWAWIGENTMALPSTHTKNRREHIFPIGQAAKEVLDGVPQLKDNPYVFPASRDKVKGKPATTFNGWGKPKAAFDVESGVSGWTLHDLRRTFSSGMAALGVPQVVVEKLLNHISGGTQSPIAQVYNRYSYMDEMQQSMVIWESYLLKLIKFSPSTS
ncbi:tyrosine-type recombinase/integrase [Thalassobaculum salexigens]|uniref:tyrosine-type recombinase/integrase n=1 Tax=Thalassobaculum salexigens TaxID=455360 RepID=UPI00056F7CA6|nr:tyrosine-type recombinase/integrase [Thalassobaculum salexigens]